jgi:hypothetical protein
MPCPPTAHPSRLPLGMLALLFAIFFWGLHYKISLYQDPAQHLHSGSANQVKLLSEAERSLSPQAALHSALDTLTQHVSPQVLAVQSFGMAALRSDCSLHICIVQAAEQMPRAHARIRPPPLA